MIDTLYLDARQDSDVCRRAAKILKSGGLVALPTETVYGLGAVGLDAKAVKKIYEVKGRPPQKPVSLLVEGTEAFSLCDNVPDAAYVLAEKFWPGPLTIVLPRGAKVPDIVTAGGNTVGLRCPQHDATLEIIRLVGSPLAAPSANMSGEESPKDAKTVWGNFRGKIGAVVDGGICRVGVESTIVDLAGANPRILRQGGLAEDEIFNAIGG